MRLPSTCCMQFGIINHTRRKVTDTTGRGFIHFQFRSDTLSKLKLASNEIWLMLHERAPCTKLAKCERRKPDDFSSGHLWYVKLLRTQKLEFTRTQLHYLSIKDHLQKKHLCNCPSITIPSSAVCLSFEINLWSLVSDREIGVQRHFNLFKRASFSFN